MTDEEIQTLLNRAEGEARSVGCTEADAEDVAAECVKRFYFGKYSMVWPQMLSWISITARRDALKVRKNGQKYSSLDSKGEGETSWIDQIPMETYEDPETLAVVILVLKQNVASCYGRCGCKELCSYLKWDADGMNLRQIASATRKSTTTVWWTLRRCRKLAQKTLRLAANPQTLRL